MQARLAQLENACLQPNAAARPLFDDVVRQLRALHAIT